MPMPTSYDSRPRHMGLKVLSVGFGVVVWWSFVFEQTVQTSFPAALHYTRVPEELELNLDQADTVTLLLAGPRGRLDELSQSPPAVEVDLGEIEAPGDYTFDIGDPRLSLPAGVRLVRAIPSQVRLSLERSVREQVSIYPDLVGTPEGRTVVGVEVAPPRLWVAGPESRMALVHNVMTDPIDLASVVGRRTFSSVAYLPDPYLRFEQQPNIEVTVTVQ